MPWNAVPCPQLSRRTSTQTLLRQPIQPPVWSPIHGRTDQPSGGFVERSSSSSWRRKMGFSICLRWWRRPMRGRINSTSTNQRSRENFVCEKLGRSKFPKSQEVCFNIFQDKTNIGSTNISFKTWKKRRVSFFFQHLPALYLRENQFSPQFTRSPRKSARQSDDM